MNWVEWLLVALIGSGYCLLFEAPMRALWVLTISLVAALIARARD